MARGSGKLQVGLSGRGGQVRNGSQIASIKQYSVAVNPASLAANVGAETTVALTGIEATDVILSCEPQAALDAGICYSARVTAADEIKIHFVNVTVGAIDVASTTFLVTVAKIAVADR